VLGHKEVAIILDRYSQALPTLQAKAMARLDTLLGRAPRRRSARGTDAADAGGSPRDKGPDKGPNRRAAGRKGPIGPIRAWIGPRMTNLVPHTGFLVKRLMRLSRVHAVHPRDA